MVNQRIADCISLTYMPGEYLSSSNGLTLNGKYEFEKLEIHPLLGSMLLDAVSELIPLEMRNEAYSILGVPNGNVCNGARLAQRLGMSVVLTEKDPSTKRVAFVDVDSLYRAGDSTEKSIVLFDDVFSTGAAILRAAELVGYEKIAFSLSFIDRSEEPELIEHKQALSFEHKTLYRTGELHN